MTDKEITMQIGWQSFVFYILHYVRKNGMISINPILISNYFNHEKIYPLHKDMKTDDWIKLFELMYNQLKTYKGLYVNRKSQVELQITM